MDRDVRSLEGSELEAVKRMSFFMMLTASQGELALEATSPQEAVDMAWADASEEARQMAADQLQYVLGDDEAHQYDPGRFTGNTEGSDFRRHVFSSVGAPSEEDEEDEGDEDES